MEENGNHTLVPHPLDIEKIKAINLGFRTNKAQNRENEHGATESSKMGIELA